MRKINRILFIGVIIVSILLLIDSYRIEPSSLVTALEKSKDFQWPIKSYVQVRKANVQKRVPKVRNKKPKLKRVIENAKITTIWIDDGYRNREYERQRNDSICFGSSSRYCSKNQQDLKPVSDHQQRKAFEIDRYFMDLLLDDPNARGTSRSKRSTMFGRYLGPKFRKKHGVLSEVYYKDEMSRNQQIDVYDDVRKHFESHQRPKFSLKQYMELILNQIDTRDSKTIILPSFEKSTREIRNSIVSKTKKKRNRKQEILGLEPPVITFTMPPKKRIFTRN